MMTFIKEAGSGLLLLLCASLALIIANSPLSSFYHSWLNADVLFWINDGLMVLFFLVISLELKREFYMGELSDLKHIMLPGVAALGGMVVPALFYYFINLSHPETLQGWAIPVATDIAFALGILSLFSRKLPKSLKVFLLSLAIFDDLGAIIIIGIFYSDPLSVTYTLAGLIILCCLGILNYLRITNLLAYLSLGIILWVCTVHSGVHATLAGVLLGFLIPFKSPLLKMENSLQPWVSYGVLPIFAFANAGVSFQHMTIDTVAWGIILGLFIGKQLGVMSFSWGIIRLKLAKLPTGSNWLQFYGVALLCGIGFTMSLFLGSLSFVRESDHFSQVQVGVLIGSLLSGITGALVLYWIPRSSRGKT